jgi:hypothetical protein
MDYSSLNLNGSVGYLLSAGYGVKVDYVTVLCSTVCYLFVAVFVVVDVADSSVYIV